MTHYREVVIETYLEPLRTSSGLRTRPVPGQGLPLDMHVECSMAMRRSQPVGTRFPDSGPRQGERREALPVLLLRERLQSPHG